MNAASLKHARVHNKVVLLFNQILPELDWLIDLDFRILDENGITKFRPDLVGLDPETREVVYSIEVSYSSLEYDLNEKKKFYEEFKAQNYVVFDCMHDKVYHFELKDGSFVEKEILAGIEKIFE